MADSAHTLVIGGGIAGLLAARRLASRGSAVTLLEAASELGGRVSAHEVDGLMLDAGAESFATRGGVVAALAAELGLAEQVVSPVETPAWVVTPDRSYPLPATGWLGMPLHPFAADVRRVLGWGGALRAVTDRVRPLRSLADDVTVGALVRDRLGDRVADRLVAPVIQGVYSRPLDELPLASIAPGLPAEVREAGGLLTAARRRRAASPAGSAVQGLEGGVAQLTAALEAQVRSAGVTVTTECAVTGLQPHAGGWRVSARGGEGSYQTDAVVLAVPLPIAREWIPSLPGENPRQVALVTLVLDAAELDSAPRGTGVLAVGGATRAKALTHATAKWPWLAERAGARHVVRLSYAVDAAGTDVTQHALADASRLLGVALGESQVRALAQVEWPDASPVRVDRALLPPGIEVVGSAAGLSGLAAIVAADVVARVEPDAT